MRAWIQQYHPWDSGWAEARTTFADGVLLIETEDRTVDEHGHNILNAGEYVEDTLKGYIKAASHKDALETIKIAYSAEFVDKYGNSVGSKPVITIAFNASEGMKYNVERVANFKMVDTATIEYDRQGGAQKYCEDSGNFSRIFCERY